MVAPLAAGEVAAQAVAAPAAVWVREQPCEPARYDAPLLDALLRVELGGLGLVLERWPQDDAALQAAALRDGLVLLDVRCAREPDAIELELHDLATQSRTARSLALGDVPFDQRPRALALAIGSSLEQSLSAALLRAERAGERALPPESEAALRARMLERLAAPGAQAEATQPPEVEERAPSARGAVELTAMTRIFPSYSTALLGVQAGGGVALGSRWTLDLDGEALFGKSELTDARGTIGAMWLYWLTAGVGVSVHADGTPELALGPRLRVGYGLADASAEREGASADNDSNVLLSALLAATLRAPIGEGASLLVGVDAGYTIVGIVFVGDQARLSGLAGPHPTALRLGLAL